MSNRGLDACLGVFTGVLAYYMYEKHPRNALPPDQKLSELFRWKWAKYRLGRALKQSPDTATA